MTREDLSAAIEQRLQETNQSQHRAALEYGLPQDAIRSVLKGHTPKLDRASESAPRSAWISTSARRVQIRLKSTWIG